MKDRAGNTVDVIIPTYKPGSRFLRLIEMLKKQSQPVNKVIIMNTERSYWKDLGDNNTDWLEVHHVTKESFDHGGTRNQGVGYSNADYVVFMTDDAVAEDERLIENLIKPMGNRGPKGEPVVISYGRQVASEDCRLPERYTRSFNYPKEGRVKTKDDLKQLGIKTYFASNVCCAYDRKKYLELGGFITKTIFNEDMIFAGNAIQKGYAVAYAADARVIHSHNYSNRLQFCRNFDLAVSQADHPEIFSGIVSEREGIRLVKKTIGYLAEQKKLYLLPGFLLQSVCKYMGYFMGKRYRKLPAWLVIRCSMNQSYWK